MRYSQLNEHHSSLHVKVNPNNVSLNLKLLFAMRNSNGNVIFTLLWICRIIKTGFMMLYFSSHDKCKPEILPNYILSYLFDLQFIFYFYLCHIISNDDVYLSRRLNYVFTTQLVSHQRFKLYARHYITF